MTNKTLSEQICEVCRIEPLNSENAYFTGNLGKLPDFEDPINFKKLFDLKIQGHEELTIAHIVTFKCGQIQNSKHFLKLLLNILQENYLINDEMFKRIKLTIRNEQWII